MNPFHSRQRFLWCFRPFCAAALCTATAVPWSNARSPIRLQREIPAAGSVSAVDRGRLIRLKHDLSARRFVVGQGVVEATTAGDGEEIIYRNATGPEVYPLYAGDWVADDLATICGSSSLTRIVVQVTGGGDGTGPGFDIEVDLYSGCPSQNGVPIIGTHFAVNLPDDGLFTVEYNLNDAPVPIGREVWLAIRSSSDHAGWVFGGEPDIGHSEDQIDTPLFGCSTNFGGCPPQGPACANGTATLHAINCVPEFVAYRADTDSAFFLPMDSAEIFADDILPITAPNLCSVTCYAPGVAGLGGTFSIETQIWSNDEVEQRPLAPVPGTACELSDGCCFNPPIEVPTARFWLTYDVTSGSDAGPVLVGDHPSIGQSDDCFAILGDPDPEYWSACVWWFGGCEPPGENPCGTFRNVVYCAGAEPTGACCILDPENEFHCVDDVPYSQCSGRFIADSTCEEGLFDPPCGTSACCLQNGNCDNVPSIDCAIFDGIWQAGEFCHVGDQLCPPQSCGQSPLPCCEARPTPGPPGCNDPLCCAIVCDIDEFCCVAAWDDTCAGLACNVCEDDPKGEHNYDDCEGAIAVACNDSILISNLFATDDPSDPGFSCHNGGPGEQGIGSVWAKFVATSSTARLRTCDSMPPADDSLLAVYTGTCSNLTEIGCNDDTPGCAATGFNSDFCLSGLNVGQTYIVQLASWTESDRGRYELEIDCPATCDPPANDGCGSAEAIGNGITPYTTAWATTDGPTLPGSCNEGDGIVFNSDVWYDYTAPETGMATADLCTGTGYDSRIAVYQGCTCPMSTAGTLACNDDFCELNGPSRAVFNIVDGQCYKIRVGGQNDDTGTGLLVISSEGTGTGPNCPGGTATFTNPMNNTVDARQPNPVNSPTPAQGIKTLTVTAPSGADPECFTMCETAFSGTANSIASVFANGNTYTITLLRPMTPFAITRIAYQPEFGAATIATFISHPGNVNGDSMAAPTDILAIIDCLNGVNMATNCPWGIYSADIDHSGVSNLADILRVIDLLNGIYDCEWSSCPANWPSPLPMGTCTP